MSLFYTGVGSRKTPYEILDFMVKCGTRLAELGYIGRSGGADGADSAFWEGFELCSKLDKKFEVYLPWNNFNGFNDSQKHIIDSSKTRNFSEAIEIMKTVHPAPDKLGRGATNLHARNVYQVLGYQLDKPSNVCILFSKPNKDNTAVSGGTNTAYQLAKKYKIPTYNLYNDSELEHVKNRLKI